MPLSTKELPRKILETAVQLKNHSKGLYLCVYECGKPISAQEVADKMGMKRAYVHMRLLGLVDRGLLKEHREGKKKLFEVTT